MRVTHLESLEKQPFITSIRDRSRVNVVVRDDFSHAPNSSRSLLLGKEKVDDFITSKGGFNYTCGFIDG